MKRNRIPVLVLTVKKTGYIQYHSKPISIKLSNIDKTLIEEIKKFRESKKRLL